MRSTRKRKYRKNKGKKINVIMASTAVTLSLIGISQVTDKTYALFTASKTINASMNAAFVFPNTLQQIIRSLPTIKCKECDENQLQVYEETANKLDYEITSYYNRAFREYESTNTDESKKVYDYVSKAYQEFEIKKQQLFEQIATIRDEIARKESEKKEKEKNKAEEKETKEKESNIQQNAITSDQSTDQNNNSSQPADQTENHTSSNNEDIIKSNSSLIRTK
ncbi:hypothetical protein ABES02_22105 [Neobacillus pocheonensis]|uniref:hypothetical protein n=1 Tax=Neobacillus pocheonensis TaxID=363869 RepID=UPI003D2A703B